MKQAKVLLFELVGLLLLIQFVVANVATVKNSEHHCFALLQPNAGVQVHVHINTMSV